MPQLRCRECWTVVQAKDRLKSQSSPSFLQVPCLFLLEWYNKHRGHSHPRGSSSREQPWRRSLHRATLTSILTPPCTQVPVLTLVAAGHKSNTAGHPLLHMQLFSMLWKVKASKAIEYGTPPPTIIFQKPDQLLITITYLRAYRNIRHNETLSEYGKRPTEEAPRKKILTMILCRLRNISLCRIFRHALRYVRCSSTKSGLQLSWAVSKGCR